jgi:hypothetical protein
MDVESRAGVPAFLPLDGCLLDLMVEFRYNLHGIEVANKRFGLVVPYGMTNDVLRVLSGS